jgi:hypothetical protein
MKARLSLIAALAALAALLVAPAAQAQTQTAAPMTQKVKLAGQTQSGKKFSGTYAIQRFTRARSGRYAGRLVSVGTVTGRMGGRRVTKRNVVMPAQLTSAATAAQGLPPLPNACTILNLRLGPINLNLLGLVVRTNEINLRIDAQRGPGNLLGNLLCAITGILDPQAAATSQLAAALNAILALVPRQ